MKKTLLLDEEDLVAGHVRHSDDRQHRRQRQ
jgi:hypothetical protein